MRALPGVTPWACRALLASLMALVAGCHTAPPRSTPVPDAGTSAAMPPEPVAVTRGAFTLHADKLDVWNAIGQIVVNANGVEYLGRAQMLDLYSLRYRGVEFLVLTKALPAAETGNRMTTRVTATTPAGKPIDTNATAELLEMLQRALPAEVERVRARQAAERKKQAAKKQAPKKKAPKSAKP